MTQQAGTPATGNKTGGRRTNPRTRPNLDAEIAEEEALAEVETTTEQPAASSQENQAATASRTAGPIVTPASTKQPAPEEEEPAESRTHLVKHRAPRAENEEEQFDSVYKRDTYYIDRTYPARLKKMIRKTQLTKTALMNEGLEMLFEKYGIE